MIIYVSKTEVAAVMKTSRSPLPCLFNTAPTLSFGSLENLRMKLINMCLGLGSYNKWVWRLCCFFDPPFLYNDFVFVTKCTINHCGIKHTSTYIYLLEKVLKHILKILISHIIKRFSQINYNFRKVKYSLFINHSSGISSKTITKISFEGENTKKP